MEEYYRELGIADEKEEGKPYKTESKKKKEEKEKKI